MGSTGSEGISFGSSVEVIGAVSSLPLRFGEGGGDGGAFGSCGDVIGAGLSSCSENPSLLARNFSRPLRFGTRKLYAMGNGEAGGWPRRSLRTPALLAIYSQ